MNSYKRLWGGAEAPSYVCWGHNNRSALVRVPMYKPGKGNSSRIEYRAVDSATNPYLAYAVLLAAGLKGIEEGYELPEGAEDDVWELTDAERRALGIEPLPTSLDAAISIMEKSELVAETLGEHVFDYFLRNKRAGVGGLPLAGDAVRAAAVPPGAVSVRSDLGEPARRDRSTLARSARPAARACPTPAVPSGCSRGRGRCSQVGRARPRTC